ncbi:MAG: HAD family hydrolase, partial [Acidimicrobiales bacterium]
MTGEADQYRATPAGAAIGAVIFDLDGVLLDSEQLWDESRRDVVSASGGQWQDGATAAMQGMSSPEWSRYMRDHLGLDLTDARIVDLVVSDLLAHYERHLPLLPGAREAVARMGQRWPLGLASSANREVIDAALSKAGFERAFAATVSSEEVPRGKPAPEVYLEAARRLGEDPARCAAVEDSTNGVRAARGAGMYVLCVPNPHFPPDDDVLAGTDAVLAGLDELTVERV